MHYLLNVCGIATAAVAFAAFAPGAVAQENIFKTTCQDVGGFAAEPIGDREGHSISVDGYSCRVNSGPMSGGVETGTIIWEWDKTNAVMVSNSGVVRKPGAILVYQGAEAKIALTMADGKVTGFNASGRGRWLTATGSAASLAGKSFTWTSKATGASQFETEIKGE
jgi:hypothetical protein